MFSADDLVNELCYYTHQKRKKNPRDWFFFYTYDVKISGINEFEQLIHKFAVLDGSWSMKMSKFYSKKLAVLRFSRKEDFVKAALMI